MTDAANRAALAALTRGLAHLTAQAGQSAPDSGEPPGSDLAACLLLADRLASGGNPDGDQQLRPLVSVFSTLNGHKQTQYVPAARLNPADGPSLFPSASAPGAPAYQALGSGAAAEWNQRTTGVTEPKVRLEHALAVLQEFGWSAPSLHSHRTPDVSLFDHSRTTAAIASALAAAGWTAADCDQAEKSDKRVALLVGGDLSGLQDFIYTLASSGAAKSLRARSF